MDVDAYIPVDYIMNEIQKLDIYKRIAGIETIQESDDMQDELRDRFGNVPKSAENLLRIALLRSRAHKLYITELKGGREQIRFQMKLDAKIQIENIPLLLKKHEKALKFITKGTPYFLYRYKKCGMVEKDEETLLQITETVLADMEELLLVRE